MLTRFESDQFGAMVLIEVGAFTVGSIQQRFQAGWHIEKAKRKGLFELGGSTVVLLFETDRIVFDDDLIANTRNDIETYVRLGNSIGRKVLSC
jgi:phosphatidylserine decarboxylase